MRDHEVVACFRNHFFGGTLLELFCCGDCRKLEASAELGKQIEAMHEEVESWKAK